MDGALRPARLGLLAAGAAVCGAALAGQLAGAGSNAVDTAALTAPLAVGYAAMGALVLPGGPGTRWGGSCSPPARLPGWPRWRRAG